MWPDRVVLASPPVISVVGDTDPTYCLTNALAACNGNLDLPELVQDLLRAVTFSWHFCLPSIHPVSDLSTGSVCEGQVSMAEEETNQLLGRPSHAGRHSELTGLDLYDLRLALAGDFRAVFAEVDV